MATTRQTSIRFTDDDETILLAIQERIGLVTHSDAIRFALRFWAKAEGVDTKPKAKRAKKP